MKFHNSPKLAYTLILIALTSLILTILYRVLGKQQKAIKPIASKEFQTKVYAKAINEGINMSITHADIETHQISCTIFNVSPDYWILYINKKIALLDVNLLIASISKIVQQKHYSDFLWELIKTIETGKVMLFDAVTIKYQDEKVHYGKKIMDKNNYLILFTYLIDAIV